MRAKIRDKRRGARRREVKQWDGKRIKRPRREWIGIRRMEGREGRRGQIEEAKCVLTGNRIIDVPSGDRLPPCRYFLFASIPCPCPLSSRLYWYACHRFQDTTERKTQWVEPDNSTDVCRDEWRGVQGESWKCIFRGAFNEGNAASKLFGLALSVWSAFPATYSPLSSKLWFL